MSTTPVTLDTYLSLITSEHNQRPKYIDMLSLYLQPIVDLQNLLNSLSTLFDVDYAQGQQLDFVGQWVGAKRQLNKTINGVSILDDLTYRILLKAVIALNHWDGTVPGAYDIWAVVFATEGIDILIQDNQDMSMFFVFIGGALSTLVIALIVNGYFDLRPAGVLMRGYFQPSIPGTPVFGFGIENATVAGFGHGAWIAPLNP